MSVPVPVRELVPTLRLGGGRVGGALPSLPLVCGSAVMFIVGAVFVIAFLAFIDDNGGADDGADGGGGGIAFLTAATDDDGGGGRGGDLDDDDDDGAANGGVDDIEGFIEGGKVDDFRVMSRPEARRASSSSSISSSLSAPFTLRLPLVPTLPLSLLLPPFRSIPLDLKTAGFRGTIGGDLDCISRGEEGVSLLLVLVTTELCRFWS